LSTIFIGHVANLSKGMGSLGSEPEVLTAWRLRAMPLIEGFWAACRQLLGNCRPAQPTTNRDITHRPGKGIRKEYDAVGSATTLPMSRPRGNPNWGKPLPPVPAGPTEFESMAKRLRLTPEMYAASSTLRSWCHRNRNQCYVPEWLLEEWGIDVEIGYGNDAA